MSKDDLPEKRYCSYFIRGRILEICVLSMTSTPTMGQYYCLFT